MTAYCIRVWSKSRLKDWIISWDADVLLKTNWNPWGNVFPAEYRMSFMCHTASALVVLWLKKQETFTGLSKSTKCCPTGCICSEMAPEERSGAEQQVREVKWSELKHKHTNWIIIHCLCYQCRRAALLIDSIICHQSQHWHASHIVMILNSIS